MASDRSYCERHKAMESWFSFRWTDGAIKDTFVCRECLDEVSGKSPRVTLMPGETVDDATRNMAARVYAET